MSKLVLVDREALAELLGVAIGQEIPYGLAGLYPDDAVVVLAVQSGLPIPGPMAPGTVPPAPPSHRFGTSLDRHACAATYRAESDKRLRCEADAKVVYTTLEQAQAAARRIGTRQPMKAYLGQCGHYHVARVKP